MRIEEVHAHTPFTIGDSWSSDPALRHSVGRYVSSNLRGTGPEEATRIFDSLAAFSRTSATDARALAALCDRPGTHPRLVQYDEWGKRVDRVETSEGWRGLKDFITRHGLVGEGYGEKGQESWLRGPESLGGRAKLGNLARLYEFVRLLIFAPDSRVSLCPFSMTDGAIRTLELYGTPEQKDKYLPKLLSRDPNESWQTGQWMTETIGGSDVGMTETRAAPLIETGRPAQAGDLYLVNGFKWFSSAIDGHGSLALARTNPDTSVGSKGLSLFIVPLHKKNRPAIPAGASYVEETAASSPFNGIKVHRLKEKFGTQNVPTAELELTNAVGELIGQEGRGVAQIASVLNITRLYCATNCVSAVGRALQIVDSYSQTRAVGVRGKPTLLKDIPMHADRLARVAVCYRALLQLYLSTTLLLGKSETGSASDRDKRRLRILTPTLKAFTSYRATEAIAQCIEALGGQGYMAENPMTEALRDTMVERIWEGTPSILSLDVARVMQQTKGLALEEWLEDCTKSVEASLSVLKAADAGKVDQIKKKLDVVWTTIKQVYVKGRALDKGDNRYARNLLELIAILTCGVGLLEQAAWSSSSPAQSASNIERGDPAIELESARRWLCGVEGGLATALAELDVLSLGSNLESADRQLAFALSSRL